MASKLEQQFGRTVRRLRLERGFSQEGFALVIRVHRTYQGSLERGEKSPSLRTIERIARGLGIGLSELFVEFEKDAEAEATQDAEEREGEGEEDT